MGPQLNQIDPSDLRVGTFGVAVADASKEARVLWSVIDIFQHAVDAQQPQAKAKAPGVWGVARGRHATLMSARKGRTPTACADR